MEKNKLILPISILVGCIILGGFFYVSQVNKQKSIERQQQIDLKQKQAELQAKEVADQEKLNQDKELTQQAETNKLITKYREECVVAEEKNNKAFQVELNKCTGEACRKNIKNLASANSGSGFIDTCIKNKLNGTYGGTGLIQKAERWTGETFLNGGLNGLGKIDSNNLPDFLSKQDCLNWGNNQEVINKTDSFKCGKNCGWVTTAGEDSFFVCDEEVDI